MLYRDISKIFGSYLLGFSGAFILPLLIAAYYQFVAEPTEHPQQHTTQYFLFSFILTAFLGSIFYSIGKRAGGHLYRREALALVVIIWVFTPIVSALPFYLSGALNNPVQAYFEAVSGLTTTGATVVQAKKFDALGQEISIEKHVRGSLDVTYNYYGNIDPVVDPSNNQVYQGIEALGKGLLFWRSFMQFLGGGGIVLLFIAILPALGLGGKMLFLAELTGSPVKGTMTPRIKETAHQIWKIYVGLTVLQIMMLVATNAEMPWFDAVTISFSTLATGGFTIHNHSIGYYQNTNTDWVILIFMLLGSISFSLYFNMIRGKFYKLYEPEFIIFILVVLASCILCATWLVGTERRFEGSTPGIFSLLESIRYGSFQVVSMLTTTGFAIADYDYWPYSIQVMLLILMFIGGMSGSTAGGIKILRCYMLSRIGIHTIESLFRPETVRQLRIADREINSGTSTLVLSFFLTLIAISVASTFGFVIMGVDPETALGLVAAMITNTGIGFRVVGPYDSMAFLSDGGLLMSAFLMILGRLEIFAVLAVLVPAFWHTKS